MAKANTSTKAKKLTAEQRRDEYGKLILQIYNRVTPAEKQHIRELTTALLQSQTEEYTGARS